MSESNFTASGKSRLTFWDQFCLEDKQLGLGDIGERSSENIGRKVSGKCSERASATICEVLLELQINQKIDHRPISS